MAQNVSPMTAEVTVSKTLQDGWLYEGDARFSDGFSCHWWRSSVGNGNVILWNSLGHDVTTPDRRALIANALGLN